MAESNPSSTSGRERELYRVYQDMSLEDKEHLINLFLSSASKRSIKQDQRQKSKKLVNPKEVLKTGVWPKGADVIGIDASLDQSRSKRAPTPWNNYVKKKSTNKTGPDRVALKDLAADWKKLSIQERETYR